METDSLPPKQAATLCRRYSGTPIFGALVRDFGTWLHGQGYAPSTIINMCRHISHLERWLRERHQVVSVSAVTPAMLVAADKYFCHRKNHYRYLTCAALHRFLRQRRLIPEPERVNPSPLRREVGLYEAHLREVRGLSASTIKDRCRRAASFLKHIGFEHGQAALSRLRHGSIERFIKREAMTNGRAGLCQVTSSLRGFLRFEFQNGRLSRRRNNNLSRAMAWRRLAPIPSLSATLIERRF
jgi:hypothetical protein